MMMGNETNDIIEELRKSVLQSYKEEPMRGSEFAPDSIVLLYYHLQKIDLKSNNKSRK